MLVERILEETHATVDAGNPYGNSDPYTCRVAARPLIECLDIAGAGTLRTSSGDTTLNESYRVLGFASGPVVVHTTMLMDVGTANSYDVNNTQLFGIPATCTNKIIGDGQINAFDAFVFASVQFSMGPYAAMGRDFGAIPTINGRNDTGARCGQSGLDRLEWALRVADNACVVHEGGGGSRRLVAQTSVGMPLLTPDPTYLDEAASLAAWSPFGLPMIGLRPQHELLRHHHTVVGSVKTAASLDATVIEYVAHDLGTWYWINIPGVHTAIDLTILGALNDLPIPLTNVRAPNYEASTLPIDPAHYELRFVRHRELYQLPTAQCSVLQSARSQLIAMERSVVTLAQAPRTDEAMCAFDLVLWKPIHTAPHRPGCTVAIAAGSVAMGGFGGTVQKHDACAVPLKEVSGSLPPPPLSPLPLPPPPPHLPCPPPTVAPPPLRPPTQPSHIDDVRHGSFWSVTASPSLYGTLLGCMAVCGVALIVRQHAKAKPYHACSKQVDHAAAFVATTCR